MSKYYAASTRGFYDDTIHHALPADAVEISDEHYETLLHALSQGEVITMSDGNPVAADYVPSEEDVARILTTQAKAALNKSDLTILRCYESAITVPAEWHTYRAALRAIVSGTLTETSLPEMPTYPSGT